MQCRNDTTTAIRLRQNYRLSTTIMFDRAQRSRTFFASAYSDDSRQALAFSNESNSRMTSRRGVQSPSRTSLFPPRTT
jgi:hypothetical protein